MSLEAAQINLDEAPWQKRSTRGCRKLTLLKTIKQSLPYHDNCCVITTTPQTVPSASSRRAAAFSVTIIISLTLPSSKRGNCSCSFLLAQKDFGFFFCHCYLSLKSFCELRCFSEKTLLKLLHLRLFHFWRQKWQLLKSTFIQFIDTSRKELQFFTYSAKLFSLKLLKVMKIKLFTKVQFVSYNSS